MLIRLVYLTHYKTCDRFIRVLRHRPSIFKHIYLRHIQEMFGYKRPLSILNEICGEFDIFGQNNHNTESPFIYLHRLKSQKEEWSPW